jgi:hypothetical protein
MRRTLPAFCILLLSLAGCADLAPVSIGPHTYLSAETGAWSWSSGAVLEGDLLRQARGLCGAEGRQLLPVSATTIDANFTRFARAELRFRCVRPGAPAPSAPKA